MSETSPQPPRDAAGAKSNGSFGDRKQVRFDAGSARDRGSAAGSLLKAFGIWGGLAAGSKKGLALVTPPPDRRREERLNHLECLAWVGWKTWRRFHMNDALLVNLSRGGARIFLDVAPPPNTPVWVYLETPGHRTVVKAQVLEVRATASGQCVVRAAFTEPCDYSVFEAAVCGLAPANPRLRLAPAPADAPPRRMPAPAVTPADAPPARKVAAG